MDTVIEIENYFKRKSKNQIALQRLRAIVRETVLKEDFKFNIPVYTYNDREVVGLKDAPDHFSVLFFNGNSLKDGQNILVNTQGEPTENIRQLRFTVPAQIDENLIKTYIEEAIAIQSQSVQESIVQKSARPHELSACEALQNAFALSKHLKERFMLLSNEMQQEYLHYFNDGANEAERSKRLEHCIPFIMRLRGIDKEML